MAIDIREAYCKREEMDRLHYQLSEGSEKYVCMSCGNVRLSQEVELVLVIIGGTK